MALSLHPIGVVNFLYAIIFLSGFAYAEDKPNPSLAIEVGFGQRPSEEQLAFDCQANLIERRQENGAWRCALATAAHCTHLPTGELTSFLRIRPFGFIRVQSVRAKSLASAPSPKDDIAIISFNEGCEKFEDKLVSFYQPESGQGAIERATELYSASRHYGVLLLSHMRQKWSFDPDASMVISIVSGRQIYQGDSGGGIFIRNATTASLELIAVLTGAWVKARARAPAERIGGFTVGASGDLDWVKSLLQPRLVADPISTKINGPSETAWRERLDLMNQFLTRPAP